MKFEDTNIKNYLKDTIDKHSKMKDYNKKLKEVKKRLNSTNVEVVKHEYFVKDISLNTEVIVKTNNNKDEN